MGFDLPHRFAVVHSLPAVGTFPEVEIRDEVASSFVRPFDRLPHFANLRATAARAGRDSQGLSRHSRHSAALFGRDEKVVPLADSVDQELPLGVQRQPAKVVPMMTYSFSPRRPSRGPRARRVARQSARRDRAGAVVCDRRSTGRSRSWRATLARNAGAVRPVAQPPSDAAQRLPLRLGAGEPRG